MNVAVKAGIKSGGGQWRSVVGRTVALAGLGGLALLQAAPAWAHAVREQANGFLTGLVHPMTGPDHLAAMLAVGLLGAILGTPAIVLLPVLFPLVMAVGAAAGIAGMPLPAVELGIAASAVVLGLMVLVGRKLPLGIAGAVVAFFAVFHGHAHGTELPHAIDALTYGIGFVVGTGLIHLAGIALGLLWNSDRGKGVVRGTGGAIALAGIVFLFGLA